MEFVSTLCTQMYIQYKYSARRSTLDVPVVRSALEHILHQHSECAINKYDNVSQKLVEEDQLSRHNQSCLLQETSAQENGTLLILASIATFLKESMLLRSLSIRKGFTECPTRSDVPSVQKRHHGGSRLEVIDNRGYWSNIFIIVPIIFTVSLLLGTIFYRIHHGWQLSTAFYFSAQVLAGDQMVNQIYHGRILSGPDHHCIYNTLSGCMYDMPTETDSISTSFSLMFFLFGSSAMAAAFGAFVSLILYFF